MKNTDCWGELERFSFSLPKCVYLCKSRAHNSIPLFGPYARVSIRPVGHNLSRADTTPNPHCIGLSARSSVCPSIPMSHFDCHNVQQVFVFRIVKKSRRRGQLVRVSIAIHKCDGPTDRRTDRHTDRPTRQGVESRVRDLKSAF